MGVRIAARSDLSIYNNSEYSVMVSVWATKGAKRFRLYSWDATPSIHVQSHASHMMNLELPNFQEYHNYTVKIETNSISAIGMHFSEF